MSTIINATTTNGVVIQPDNSGSLQLATNSGTTAVTIDTSQNVGIGTTSPSVRLHLKGASYANAIRWEETGGNNNFYAGPFDTSGNFGLDNNSSSGYTRFVTNSTERMRIDSSGLVSLRAKGTPTDTDFVLQVYADGTTGGVAVQTNQTSGRAAVRFRNPNGVVGQIETSGSSTSYATSSDYRLKENIAPMTGALAVVGQLKPCTYIWKSDGSDGQGFIAHELAEVVPDCVTGEKDAVETYIDEDGVEQTRPVYQGIDTSFLVATLTAAIQEQQTIINDLKARVEALEAK